MLRAWLRRLIGRGSAGTASADAMPRAIAEQPEAPAAPADPARSNQDDAAEAPPTRKAPQGSDSSKKAAEPARSEPVKPESSKTEAEIVEFPRKPIRTTSDPHPGDMLYAPRAPKYKRYRQVQSVDNRSGDGIVIYYSMYVKDDGVPQKDEDFVVAKATRACNLRSWALWCEKNEAAFWVSPTGAMPVLPSTSTQDPEHAEIEREGTHLFSACHR